MQNFYSLVIICIITALMDVFIIAASCSYLNGNKQIAQYTIKETDLQSLSSSPQINSDDKEEEEDVIAEAGATLDSVEGMSSILLSGTYQIDSGQTFCFSGDGEYSGFFDDSSRYVKNASYSLEKNDDDTCNLKIVHQGKKVTYLIVFREKGKVEISFSDDIFLELKKVNTYDE